MFKFLMGCLTIVFGLFVYVSYNVLTLMGDGMGQLIEELVKGM